MSGIAGAVADISQLRKAFGLPIGVIPQLVPKKSAKLHRTLILEETGELVNAIRSNDLPGIADGIIDVIVVCLQAGLEYGLPLEELWKEVHRANMDKLGADGKPIIRSDGKFLKPDGWQPPQIRQVLSEAGWGHTWPPEPSVN